MSQICDGSLTSQFAENTKYLESFERFEFCLSSQGNDRSSEIYFGRFVLKKGENSPKQG